MAKIPMPSYVIIEKREFEQLFDKVEQSGDTITALNSSKNSTRTKSRFHLSNRASKTKSRKKRSRSRSQEKNEQKSKRRRTDGGSDKETEGNSASKVCKTERISDSGEDGSGNNSDGEKCLERLGYDDSTSTESSGSIEY